MTPLTQAGTTPRRRALAARSAALVLAFLLTGCTFSIGQPTAEDTPTAAGTPAPERTPPAGDSDGDSAGGGGVDFADVQSATLQIEAFGTFVSPEGAFEAAGRGSGFLISSDGVAVTNNHVVVGAGTVQVWRGGDASTSLNARLLGSSECLDLAVIDLDGEGYPYLEWRSDDIVTALDVYAAGFPLGDPTFTMTRGIVSKASTSGETPWASIDSVIEHDARIRGGNSGGPLVDPDGHVVGVNYAGIDEHDINLAIHRDAARDVVEQLAAGERVLSLGINAEALVDDEGTGGIWVASVAAGSPADQAGIEPGDLLTRLQGVTLATQGTMSEYCDVLRTHGQDAALDVELFRSTDDLYYRGQVNGDERLEPVSVLGPEDGGGDGGATGEFVTVTDDAGIVSVEVPADWADVDGSSYTDEQGVEWARIAASSDLAAYRSSWATPGLEVTASAEALSTASIDDILAANETVPSASCTEEGRDAYDDGYYTGTYSLWTDCGDAGAGYLVVAATDSAMTHAIVIQVQANSDEDIAAVDRALGSVYVSFE